MTPAAGRAPEPRGAPLVSVVIPCYRQASYVGFALESLAAQTCPDWEAVVVNDGSPDDTSDVVRGRARTDPRIRLVEQENQGLSAARNTGIRHSTGEYVQFLDSDDLLEPRKFEMQTALLDANPGVGIVYGGVRYVDSDGGDHRPSPAGPGAWMPLEMQRISGAGEALVTQLLHGNIMVVNAPLIRRSLVDRVGEFDVTLRAVEDWDYWIRCAIAGAEFRYDDSPGTAAVVRTYAGSMSTDARRMNAATSQMQRKLHARIAGDQRLRRELELSIAFVEFEMMHRDLRAGAFAKPLWRLLRFGLANSYPRLVARCACAAVVLPFRRDGVAEWLITGYRGWTRNHQPEALVLP